MEFKIKEKYRLDDPTYPKHGCIIQIDDIEDSSAIRYEIIKGNGTYSQGFKGYFYSYSPFAEHLVPINQTIIIYNNGDETVAVLKENKQIVARAVAKCSPLDDYSFENGAKLAFKRLLSIVIGDKVKVTNIGYTYDRYSDWVKQNYPRYLNNFVKNKTPTTDRTYIVVGITKHEIDKENVYLIQNPDTTQVFIVAKKGLEKCTK